MEKGELRDVLYESGLSQYQTEVYVTLLELGRASALEIAEACEVPQSRIYDVLRDLDSKGYVETFQQDTLQARLSDADPVRSTLERKADRFQEAAEEIDRQWDQPAIDNYVASIVTRYETVFDHAESEIADAETEVLAALSPDQFRELRPLLRDAYERGVVVNVVINTTDERAVPGREEYADCVTELRYRSLSGPFHVHVDRRYLVFWPYAHARDRYGLLLDEHAISYIFYWYFQTCLWRQWRTEYDDRGELPVQYTDFRRVAGLLSDILEGGRRVEVAVLGIDPTDGSPVDFEGVVTAVEYKPVTRDGVDPDSDLRYAGRTTVRVDTDDGEYTLGGWGAFEEDVEMQRMSITSVDPPTPDPFGR
jgi:sugar-specific transcriptional regulator TrmB